MLPISYCGVRPFAVLEPIGAPEAARSAPDLIFIDFSLDFDLDFGFNFFRQLGAL